MSELAALTIDPGRLTAWAEPWTGPVALVRLDDVGGITPEDVRLPPCPVIGIGDPAQPLADVLDTVVEWPVSVERIAEQVLRHPRAAAVIVALLRLLPKLAPEDGLVAESHAYGLLQGSAEHRAWLAEPRAAEMGPGAVRAERQDDVLALTLDRPWAGNAIDRPMRDALYQAFALAALDPTVARVTLAGAGRAFCLGADLAEFGTTRDPAMADAIRARTLPARMIVRCAAKLEARVQGACVGAGLEMAAFARRVVAQPDAWFQLPELAMGVLPGAGGCVSLTRRIGRQRTALMILSGKRTAASTALAWGLVDELAGDEGGAHV